MSADKRPQKSRGIALLPGRLGRRLQVSIMLVALLTHLVVAAVVLFAFSYHSRTVSNVDARGYLREVVLGVERSALEADHLAIGLTEQDGVYGLTVDPVSDPARVDALFGAWAAALPPDATVVWCRASGDIIRSVGESSQVRALAELVDSRRTADLGALGLAAGPVAVAVHPIIQAPGQDPAGAVVVAQPITQASFVGFETGLSLGDPLENNASADGWYSISGPAAYSSVQMRVTNLEYQTNAILLGIDGQPALSVRLIEPNPALGDVSLGQLALIPLAFLLAMVGVAQLEGRMLSRGVDRPLHQGIEHLREQGERALKGLPLDVSDGYASDARVSDDFKMLSATVNDLMEQLRTSQTEMMAARESAVARERAFASVVEESPEIKILVRGACVEIANPAATQYLGLRAGDVIEAGHLTSGVRLTDETGAEQTLAEVLAAASGGTVPVHAVAPDGAERWIEFSVIPLRSAGHGPSAGALEEYVISARNVTEERRLEALREEVLSLVSHDLRSPLTVVLGYLDILERTTEDERGQMAVSSAKRAAWRMEELLRDLTSATRAVRVLAPGVMRPIDLATLATNVAAALQVDATQTIELSAPEPVMVLGDRVRLEQAVTNLVGNAAKHGPRTGSISVTVGTHDGRARLTVDDEGPGVPEDQREAIFERARRGANSDATPGMGLGLYIVRVVAEAHGGTAFVDGSADHTRFVLDLPLALGETADA